MKKYEKIYDKLSKIYFVIHVLVFVVIFAASFMPFYEDLNFYQYGSPWVPYVSLALLLIAVWASYRAIKSPKFALMASLLTVGFFVLMIGNMWVTAYLQMMLTELFGGDVSFVDAYNIGFDVMAVAIRVMNIDIPFTIYAMQVRKFKMQDQWYAKQKQKESEVA